MDLLRFRCPCGKVVKAAAAKAGKEVRCPRCLARVTVPEPPEAAPVVSPPAATDPMPPEGQEEFQAAPARPPYLVGGLVAACVALALSVATLFIILAAGATKGDGRAAPRAQRPAPLEAAAANEPRRKQRVQEQEQEFEPELRRPEKPVEDDPFPLTDFQKGISVPGLSRVGEVTDEDIERFQREKEREEKKGAPAPAPAAPPAPATESTIGAKAAGKIESLIEEGKRQTALGEFVKARDAFYEAAQRTKGAKEKAEAVTCAETCFRLASLYTTLDPQKSLAFNLAGRKIMVGLKLEVAEINFRFKKVRDEMKELEKKAPK